MITNEFAGKSAQQCAGFELKQTLFRVAEHLNVEELESLLATIVRLDPHVDDHCRAVAAFRFCEKGAFDKALPLYEGLVAACPDREDYKQKLEACQSGLIESLSVVAPLTALPEVAL